MARRRNDKAFDARRKAILRAAETLFAEHGFHQTGMAAICAAAKLSPGALYRYFGSKTEIIRAIVEEERAAVAGLLDSLEASDDLRADLLAAIEASLQEVSRPAYARLALEVAAEAARDPALRAVVADSEALARDRLAALLDAARKRGEVAAAVNALAGATLILMLVEGGTSAAGAAFAALSPRVRRVAIGALLDGILGLEPAPSDVSGKRRPRRA